MRRKRAICLWKGLAAVAAAVGLSACTQSTSPTLPGGLETLVVLTRNAPTTYYTNKEDHRIGLEYDMVTSFARELGLPVEFKVLDTVDEILSGLRQGHGDMAAAGLTTTEARGKEFMFGPAYQEIEQQLVCRQGVKVKRIKDLIGKDLLIAKNSSYEAQLEALRSDYPGLGWRTTTDLSTEQILHAVWQGEVPCTVADSHIVSIQQRFMPELRVVQSVKEKDSLAWLIPKHRKFLKPLIEQWFAKASKSGELPALLEKYYGHVESFDYYDTKVFLRRAEERLPKYRKLLAAAAEQHGLPWKLLAAVSYQESHWNPKAKSPTGVRGFMMLTQTTARSVGVTNRLDPSQSIMGGAQYLKRMMERIPNHIQEPDRTWMALASYNVGFSHFQDARKIAIALRTDPNSWHTVKDALPLLSQKRYYRHLRYGYARGVEPVIYVERIRNYYDLLAEKAL